MKELPCPFFFFVHCFFLTDIAKNVFLTARLADTPSSYTTKADVQNPSVRAEPSKVSKTFRTFSTSSAHVLNRLRRFFHPPRRNGKKKNRASIARLRSSDGRCNVGEVEFVDEVLRDSLDGGASARLFLYALGGCICRIEIRSEDKFKDVKCISRIGQSAGE